MPEKSSSRSIFEQRRFVILFALTAVFAWGFAYPLIKLGLAEFQVPAVDTGGKTLFAGIRFFLSGVCILGMVGARKADLHLYTGSNTAWVALFALVNTTIHYFCFYIGLSNSAGTRAALFDPLGTFLLVVLACVFIPGERMTLRKVTGCLLGFAGILIINIGGTPSGAFTFGGDGMLCLSALASAFGGILTRIVCKKVNALAATGYSLAWGGLLLIAIGLLMGGRLPCVTGRGIFILCCLSAVSIIGFSLYNQLLSCNPVGEIAIFNAFIPVFGTLLYCLLLREPFYLKYIPAALLIAAGVYVVNRR